jgi:hypothetical protein
MSWPGLRLPASAPASGCRCLLLPRIRLSPVCATDQRRGLPVQHTVTYRISSSLSHTPTRILNRQQMKKGSGAAVWRRGYRVHLTWIRVMTAEGVRTGPMTRSGQAAGGTRRACARARPLRPSRGVFRAAQRSIVPPGRGHRLSQTLGAMVYCARQPAHGTRLSAI